MNNHPDALKAALSGHGDLLKDLMKAGIALPGAEQGTALQSQQGQKSGPANGAANTR